MANADRNNVTKRAALNRPLTFVEGDQNLDQLINVIEDQQGFETTQGQTNQTFSRGIDDLEEDVNGVSGVGARLDVAEQDIDGLEQFDVNLGTNATGKGSDLVAHTGTTDTVTEALDKRTIYVGSVAELEALPTAGFVDGQVFDVRGGQFRFNSATGGFDPTGPIPVNAFGAVTADGTANDYAAFSAAGTWLKVSPDRRVSLQAGKTYYLSYTGNLFFNGIEGNGADVIIDTGGFLEYDRLVADDIFYLNNVNLYKVGDRSGVLDTATIRLYSYNNTILHAATCTNVKVFGITTKTDKTSWVDDVGKTRFGRFLDLKSKESHIENVQSFGIGLTLRVAAVAGGRHFERNVKSYNCETNLWIAGDNFDVDIFDYGLTQEISLINTPAQKAYYIGMDAGVETNGKDALLLRAKHLKHDISGLTAAYPIERAGYLQSENINLTGVSSDGGVNCLDLKNDVTVLSELNKNNTVSGVNIVSMDNGGASACNFYGQKDLSLKDFYLAAEIPVARPGFSFENGVVGADISNGTVKNLGYLLRLNRDVGGLEVSGITLSNIVASEVYNRGNNLAKAGGLVYSENAAGERISDVKLNNISHVISNPAFGDLARSSYYLKHVDGIELSNVTGWSNYYPFVFENCTDITVKDSLFKMKTNQSFGGFFPRLINEVNTVANHFDFKISCNNILESLPSSMLIRCVGDSSVPIQCVKNWKEITICIDIPDNTNFFITIPLGADYSYDLSATLGDNQLVLANDGSGAGSTTIVRNFGSRLSHTGSTTAIRVYNSGAGDIIVRNDTSDFVATPITGGQLKIVMTR